MGARRANFSETTALAERIGAVMTKLLSVFIHLATNRILELAVAVTKLSSVVVIEWKLGSFDSIGGFLPRGGGAFRVT